jgi:hypothetical protein
MKEETKGEKRWREGDVSVAALRRRLLYPSISGENKLVAL